MSSAFDFLQSWYASSCDGDWEHSFGIKIENLDNPGWVIEIDLEGTSLENKTFKGYDREGDDENDFVLCKIENRKFIGVNGVKNLDETLRIFKEFAEG